MSREVTIAIRALQLLEQNLSVVSDSCETLVRNAGTIDKLTLPSVGDQRTKTKIVQSFTGTQASVRAVNADIERVRPMLAKLIAGLQAL